MGGRVELYNVWFSDYSMEVHSWEFARRVYVIDNDLVPT